MNLRIFLLLVFLFGCQSNKNKLDLNFQVKGLKKGKITLKKLNDSSYFKIDSFVVKGDKIVNFTYDLKEPENLDIDTEDDWNKITRINNAINAT